MRMTYVVHIIAGTLAVICGYVALFTAKGATVHRRSGMLFVYAMVTTGLFGVFIAATRSVAPAINIPAGLLTAYLVITALTTVRPPFAASRWLNPALTLVAFAVGLTSLGFAYDALTSSDGTRNGMPAFPFIMFGIVGTLAGVLNVRMIRAGGVRGAARIARHLWRMCFALFIAGISFFIGQSQIFPKAIRKPALLALPLLIVLVSMLYWLWRVRVKRSLRGLVRVHAVEPA